MQEIWEQTVAGRGAVVHGTATLFVAWQRDRAGIWKMLGSFWSRKDAQEAFLETAA